MLQRGKDKTTASIKETLTKTKGQLWRKKTKKKR
jgi:hypothetical protein